MFFLVLSRYRLPWCRGCVIFIDSIRRLKPLATWPSWSLTVNMKGFLSWLKEHSLVIVEVVRNHVRQSTSFETFQIGAKKWAEQKNSLQEQRNKPSLSGLLERSITRIRFQRLALENERACDTETQRSRCVCGGWGSHAENDFGTAATWLSSMGFKLLRKISPHYPL